MEKLNAISKTLFIPMMGRIYACEKFPHILTDDKVLSLKNLIPKDVNSEKQSQYTFLASASRSVNMDYYIQNFIAKNPDCAVMEIGCGLETTYWRCKNKPAQWFCLDIKEVIDFRKKLLPEQNGLKYFSESMFEEKWMDEVKKEIGNKPLLISAGGLFHYFKEEEIITLFKTIQSKFKNVYVVFDTLNKYGIKGIKKYMEQIGHSEAVMYFYVDSGKDLVLKIGGNAELLDEKKYYKNISRKNTSMATRISMNVSDFMFMVKMIYIKLN